MDNNIEETLHEIDKKLDIYIERAKNLLDTHERIRLDVKRLNTTIYENGLNTRVKELHEEMLARKLVHVRNDQQDHERNLLGVKMTMELRQIIISGVISGGFMILAVLIK